MTQKLVCYKYADNKHKNTNYGVATISRLVKIIGLSCRM